MTTSIKPLPAERCSPLRSVCAVRPSARANRRRPALSATLQPTIPPSPITRKCRAGYSPALAHLNPTARATNKPLNSTRQSLRSLHFVTRSLRSVGKRCSAEKNPYRRCTPLRSVCAACRARRPTDAGPYCPHPRNARPQKPTNSALQASLHLRGKNSLHSAAAPRLRSTQLHESTRYGSGRCRALYQ